MSKLPTVAIIGRPNTGKSTLFNRLVGRRKAIVSDIPGTTRDHVAHKVEGADVDYLLIDTGGMGGGTEDTDLEDDVHKQSVLALEHADVIVLTVNSREELTASDFDIVATLRKNKRSHVPVIVAATKCDDPMTIDELLPQYYELGIAEHVIAVSAPHKIGVDDLESCIESELKKLHFQKEEDSDAQRPPRIAIIGKPNVGKSSIVNAFMSETQREKSPLLVSDIPGTTRDTTDTIIRFNEKEYMFMDTAGIKRRRQTVGNDIETHAYFRSVKALEMCDICVLVLDVSQPVSKQDKRIAAMAVSEGKGLIVLLNKADLLPAGSKKSAVELIQYELKFCKFAMVQTCSAESREGLLKIFDLIESAQRNRTRRIPTNDLHRWFRDTVLGQPMSSLAKCKHITQAEEVPPSFVLFVKNPQRIRVTQLRALENSLRRTYAFEGTPIRWILKTET
ncbi:ribosome biogenesis GTPase Der [Candidatus Peregrinibacteria bacterium CG10_big_fil_rev_8_21_14_0_10_49_24]|nr:MAG: ribosome biogenesis GTPase Der [Candidatus Peregrinibacteria bacterium CG11_big_fil_rev_8_21_14_0_20_49_14]PIR50675.1 MAG: ribosome biogenesis GTPase Der [Candidatus Peregrinibacteria bacterium CG10_big_fil_rev_8_21_14_0_10_49_24]PJA67437.1 MAG: ribosome biogenesis GTPase Der [Candidatus Peregrinibacteria bacterium CG_4_9_14_3_um_filter_49_12]